MQTIYLAGGCFWGVEAYFKLIPGVKKTVVGYANSRTKNPTYREVCSGLTNAVEVCEITYNPQVLSLEQALEYFYRIIDPTKLNKQGGDIGTQYRTGVYYVNKEDETVINASLTKLQTKYHEKIVVENKKLANFYPAELYHQDYLENNPDGYCHVDLSLLKEDERKINKPKVYKRLLEDVDALFNGNAHELTVMSNVSALIKERFPRVSWVGFYLVHNGKLILGPFQGKVACNEIKFNAGVCGLSYREARPVIVSDVSSFPGHIACDPLSRSEIVVPLFNKDDEIIGVLDLDSEHYDNFDEEDELYLTKLINKIKKFFKEEKR